MRRDAIDEMPLETEASPEEELYEDEDDDDDDFDRDELGDDPEED